MAFCTATGTCPTARFCPTPGSGCPPWPPDTPGISPDPTEVAGLADAQLDQPRQPMLCHHSARSILVAGSALLQSPGLLQQSFLGMDQHPPSLPPNRTIERTAEYVIPLPPFQVDQKKAYPPYSQSDRKNPKTNEQLKQDRRDYEKRLRERRKELGLCASCRNPAIPGRTRCPACTEQRRQMRAKHKQRHRQGKPETQADPTEKPDRSDTT